MIVFPRTDEMIGVTTPNSQFRATDAVSPTSQVLPFPPVSVKVGSGAVGLPPVSGSAQLMAPASPTIRFWYWSWTAGSPVPCQAVGLLAA